MRQPWFWAARGAWYVWHAGKQKRLHEEQEAAFSVWAELLSVAEPEGPRAILASIVEAFLDHSERHHAASTYKWYGYYLAELCAVHGHRYARDLKPHHVTKWLNAHAWPDSSRRAAICAVKAAYSWAAREQLLAANHMQYMRKPAAKQREATVTADQHKAIMEKTDGAFRVFLAALKHTGARPGEVAKITAANLTPDGGAWVLREHKTAKKVRKPRVIYLSPCAATITRILAASRPTGPLFLNRRGRPWKKNAVKDRMKRLRKALDLPAGTVAYLYRHTFTTDGLTNGVPIATMAELLGHGDVRMISDHYGHLEQRAEHLKAAAATATTTVNKTIPQKTAS